MVVVCLFFWVCPNHTQHFVNSALQAHIFHLCFISPYDICFNYMKWGCIMGAGMSY